MTVQGLEENLEHLAATGTLIKDRGYRQVWRFEHAGRAYFLKFYPREGLRDAFRRFSRGSPAVAEFTRLKWLQKADIPAPRPVAVMMGFKIDGRRGDAVILEAIEPSVQLDQLLDQLDLQGEPIPDRLALATALRELIKKLAAAGLGHSDLHLGNVLLSNGSLYLLDAYAVHRGGLRKSDVMLLGHSVARWATRTDLMRGWYALGPDEPPPRRNQRTHQHAQTWLQRVMKENRYFGRIVLGDWSGVFFRYEKHPRRWSRASQLEFTSDAWKQAGGKLLEMIDADQLTVIKRSRSGDVLKGELTVGEQTLSIVVKHPRRRHWYRYINEIGRGPRARREWRKAWKLLARNLPTAWPLLMLERRRLGYVTDSMIVFELAPGTTLRRAALDNMEPKKRDMLFRRVGRLLRRIEEFGFAHFDAKASNWIVREDDKLGPQPMLIDVDGVRQRQWRGLGIRRLLRSMREHPQYNRGDSLALCQGYAPYAAIVPDPPDEIPASIPSTHN